MKRILFSVWSTGLFVFAAAVAGIPASASGRTLVKDIRMSASGDATRVVFDLTQAPSEQVFTLHSPERVVIDLNDARLDLANGGWPASLGVVKEFRSAERGNGVLRIVLEVSQLVESRSFVIAPSDGTAPRLVIDIAAPGKLGAPVAIPTSIPVNSTLQPVKSLAKESEGRLLIIAIDAGHGGT